MGCFLLISSVLLNRSVDIEQAMKIDPYKHKEQYLKWKVKVSDGIPGIRKENSDIILQYLFDMELGLNVSSKSKKGSRSYTRLNHLRQKLISLAKKFEDKYNVALIEITEKQLISLFTDLKNGTIKRNDGKTYTSIIDFVNPFKAFWHWHMKVQKKAGITITDITEDLDTSKIKPKWVYLTEEQVKQLASNAKPKYRVLIMFLYDTGMRSPGELINLKVSDLYDDGKKLNIREDIVKKGSFGRRINLMLCPNLLKDYIKENGLTPNDYLFPISPPVVNRYLKRLARRLFGDDITLAGDKYSSLTMYDFRHCSCCYWLPRYKSESALKYRFGWKKSDKIHYYSELLGMKDTISEEDMLLDVSKTEIERKLTLSENSNTMLTEKLQAQQGDINKLFRAMQILVSKFNQIDSLIKSNTLTESCSIN